MVDNQLVIAILSPIFKILIPQTLTFILIQYPKGRKFH